MAKINFNEHLDDMMERLMAEDLTPEQLELEIKRSKALCEIAEKKIQDKKVTVMALDVVGNIEFDKGVLPPKVKEILQIGNE